MFLKPIVLNIRSQKKAREMSLEACNILKKASDENVKIKLIQEENHKLNPFWKLSTCI